MATADTNDDMHLRRTCYMNKIDRESVAIQKPHEQAESYLKGEKLLTILTDNLLLIVRTETVC